MKKRIETFVLAILAGVAIAIGGTVFLSVENKVIGAVLFSVGLFIICTFQFNLFTGKACYILENDKNYLINIPIIWIGNFLGTFLTAKLESLTRIGEKLQSVANGMCEIKLNDSLLSLFLLGIFCNILIFVAVESYKNNKHEVGKYLGLLFGVVVFILAGFEHSIADMYYFSIANMWNFSSLLAIIIISLGNIVGGLLIPLARKMNEKLEVNVRHFSANDDPKARHKTK